MIVHVRYAKRQILIALLNCSDIYVSYCMIEIVKSLLNRLYVKSVKGFILERALYTVSAIVMQVN